MNLTYMYSILRYLAPVALCCVMTACGNSTISEQVASAEIAFAGDDVAATRRICDEIVGEHTPDGSIVAAELGRLSILYMQLYDRTDDADALDQATRCYRMAFEQNADSAAYFYSHLPVEQDKYAISLAGIVNSIDHPAEISDLHDGHDDMEEADSVAYQDIH